MAGSRSAQCAPPVAPAGYGLAAGQGCYDSRPDPVLSQFDLTEGRFSAQEASLYARKNDALDMARKIVELLDDPERRARMGACDRHRVENELEWKYEAPKLLAAYEALFGGPGQGPGSGLAM